MTMNIDVPFRYDSLYGFTAIRPRDVLTLDTTCGDNSFTYMGITVREAAYADLATRTVFKVVKTHPMARRKRYSVVRVQEPCILALTDPLTGRKTLVVHPALMAGLKEAARQ